MAFRMKWAGFVLAGAITAGAWASPPEQADGLQVIVEQQRELQRGLDGIEGLTPRQRNAIRKHQQQVFTLTEGRHRLDELNIDEKVKLDNALERINAELAGTRSAREAEDQCRRERRNGRAMETTQCATAGERDQVRENSRNVLERRRICEGVCG